MASGSGRRTTLEVDRAGRWGMRYAIVRRGDGLPSLKVQRSALVPADPEVVGYGQRWLLQQMHKFEAGDEVWLWSLDLLRLTTAELLSLLLRLFDLGVAVRLTGGSEVETLDPGAGAARILSLLGEHERRWPSRPTGNRRGRAPERLLTPFQARYARELLRRGESRRVVGLLFQLAPVELSAQLAGGAKSDPHAVETRPTSRLRKIFTGHSRP